MDIKSIATRLRERAARHEPAPPDKELLIEAAIEIERLNAELWKSSIVLSAATRDTRRCTGR